ncbi:MAG: hypothetical protein ACOC1K_06585 [Nanoarchaeota archaeon]
MVFDIPPKKDIKINKTLSKGKEREMTDEEEENYQDIVLEKVQEAIIKSRKEIFDLLLDEVITRCPYDTDPNRPKGKPHLRDKIKENSRLEAGKIIIGWGDYVDPYTGEDYGEFLNYGFANKLGATAEYPATKWYAKILRMRENRLEDPSSVTPFLLASIYGNFNNMIKIIINNIKLSIEELPFVENVNITGGLV